MRILLSELRKLTRTILESFESDKEDLISLYPDHEREISGLGPKWIKWLSTRFGSNANLEEIHPFRDSLTTILSFSKKDSAISQKYSSNKQWKEAVDEEFPNKKWKNPADAATMTIDDMEILISMSQRKNQTVEISKDIDISGDFLMKIGPWNIWMPSTKENSCQIAGFDPVTRKSKTSWCTARTSGSNLFYNYVGGDDVTLFYLIKDGAIEKNERISIGFMDGKPEFGGGFDNDGGGVTVNAENEGLSKSSLKSIFGSDFDSIMDLLASKANVTDEIHPTKKKISDAAKDLKILISLLESLSKADIEDIKMMVARQTEISLDVINWLAKDESSKVRATIAINPATPLSVLSTLMKDKDNHVKTMVLRNKNTVIDDSSLLSFAKDKSDNIRKEIASRKELPLKIAKFLAKDENRDVRARLLENLIGGKFRKSIMEIPPDILEIVTEFIHDRDGNVRTSIAGVQSLPKRLLVILARDQLKDVRAAVALNPATPLKSLSILAQDESWQVKLSVALNPAATLEMLNILVRDESYPIASSARKAINNKLHQ